MEKENEMLKEELDKTKKLYEFTLQKMAEKDKTILTLKETIKSLIDKV